MQTKFGAIIVDGSGKIGGHVATKNRNGNALRTKIKPSNKNSIDQQAIRSIFAQVAKKWLSLTPEQVQAWNAAAENSSYSNSFGDKKKLTGRALFQQVNSNLLMCNFTMREDPPTDEDIIETEDDYWEDYFDLLTYHSTGTLPTTGCLVIEATKPLRNGQSNLTGKFRKVGIIAGNSQDVFDYTTLYTNKFGAPVVGQRIVVRVYTINSANGRRSQMVVHDFVVQAH
jgi:hypothetical protein